MPRFVAAAALAALVLLAAAPARADKVPDAAQVRAAAEHFDAGASAFKARSFEDAASHFEAADAAVPTPKTLRQAIRARSEAGQGARAATLAALALERYPGDEATIKLAKDTIAQVEPLVQTLKISCASPCVLAFGTRSVPGEATTRWTLYLDPGKVTLAASFFGGSGAQQDMVAVAGQSRELRFEPAEAPSKKPATPAVVPASAKPGTPEPDKSELPPGEVPVTPKADETPGRGLHPAFFFAGLAATAGVGGVTIWSAVDTATNPGPDYVKQVCAGKGESCPEYQTGRSKQLRTNILIGASAGTAAVTLVLAIFTNWGGSKKAKAQRTILPMAAIDDRGAGLGAQGTF
ncbi:MAG: hypothetical protein ABI193_07455 [Minicystis sp.]